MRIVALPFLALTAALALGACTNTPQDQPAQVPPSGSTLLNPGTTSGQSNAIGSGSSSNAASGSMILQQEGPPSALGFPRY